MANAYLPCFTFLFTRTTALNECITIFIVFSRELCYARSCLYLEVEMTDLFSTAPRIVEAPKVRENQTVFEQYMTPPELSRALKIGAHVLKHAMDSGQLEIFAINGRIKLRTEEVLAFVDARQDKRRRAAR
jgi:hypothetical protein